MTDTDALIRSCDMSMSYLQKPSSQKYFPYLDIPHDRYTQVGMFPIAYTIGTAFKRVYRKPVSEVLTYNRF